MYIPNQLQYLYNKLVLFRTKNLPSFINNRLSSRSSECTAARFKYPANRPGGGGRYSLPLRAVSSPRHFLLSAHSLSGRVSLDSVLVFAFLRIKCTVSTSFPSTWIGDVLTFFFFSFCPLFIVRLRNYENYAGSESVSRPYR